MKTIKLVLSLIFTLSLFSPPLVQAHDFQQTDGLFFNANSALYRQKTADRDWQLVSLPATTITQTAVFAGQLYLVGAGPDGQTLYQQDRSLRFTRVTAIPTSPLVTIKVVNNWLVVLTSGNSETLYVSTGDNFVATNQTFVASPSDLDRLIVIGNELDFLSQEPSSTQVYRYQSSWLLTSQLNCGQSLIETQPQILLSCDDGRLLYPTSSADWSALQFPLVRNVVTGPNLIVGWDKNIDHVVHIWSSGQASDISLPSLSINQIQQTTISGQRIFFRATDLWSELIWLNQPPTLLQLSASPTDILVDPKIGGQLFLSGANSFFSATAGSWTPIITTGSFNQAKQTPLGWLVWQANGSAGSLTQFAPNGSTTFSKVNPWSSTTSPIQATSFTGSVGYVSVVTNSGAGNVNLYKTTDYVHWTRLTLPTKPTVSASVSDARSLPPSSLVEVKGVLQVGPNVVESDVTYLADDLSGIQLYLSKSIGNLPTATGVQAVATGEISSSQTKRITLSDPSDLELGSPTVLTPPTVSASDATSYIGRSVLLQGSVSSFGTDYVLLNQLDNALKLHFANPKSLFQANDQISGLTVIDWNAQSGTVEAWATSSAYQIVSRVINQPDIGTDAPSTTPAVSVVASNTGELAVATSVNPPTATAASTNATQT